MKKILIFGSGSIGNHMTNASIKLGYEVFITDKNNSALTRMKKKIFINRYGYWSKKINLVKYNDVAKLKILYDLVILGTPPETHLDLFNFCKREIKFKKLLIEKPLSVYNQNYYDFKFDKKKYFIFCGYNHSLSPSIIKFFDLIKNKQKSHVEFIDIKWKEGWKGILNAHSWLKDEFSSYLGNIKKGGGAIHEHSHALHLALKFINLFFNKKKIFRQASFIFKKKKQYVYDKFVNIFYKHNLQGLNLEIDLFNAVSEKKITIYTKDKIYKWVHNQKKNQDMVEIIGKKNSQIIFFKKNRETEFKVELQHILNIKSHKEYFNSPINIEKGTEVMQEIRFLLNKEKNLNS